MATSPPHGGGGGGGREDRGNESFSEPEMDEPEEQGGADRTGLMLYDFEGNRVKWEINGGKEEPTLGPI